MIVEAPASANLVYTMERTEAIAAIARKHPEVLYTYVTAGTPLPLRTPGVDQAHIYMKLSPANERATSAAASARSFARNSSKSAG